MKLPLKTIRLRLAWLLAPICLYLAWPSLVWLLVGAMLAVPGLLLRAWAAGTIHKNAVLTTSGPYAYTRNPLYLGSFLIGLGLAVAAGRPVILALFLVSFAAVYGPTMRRERRSLSARFGVAYDEYAARVPLFAPRLSPYQAGEPLPAGFELRRYLGHGEHQTALGILLGFLALAAKMALF